MRKRAQRGLATWAKWAIGIGVVMAFLGLGAFSVISWDYFTHLSAEIMDPEHAEQVAGTIAAIGELPEQYQYTCGLELPSWSPVSGAEALISDQSNHLEWVLTKFRGDAYGSSADELLDNQARSGMSILNPSGQQEIYKFDVRKKGKVQVGGVNAPYILGVAKSQAGVRKSAFACCILPDKVHMVIISGMSPTPDQPVTMKAVSAFLNYIESFQ